MQKQQGLQKFAALKKLAFVNKLKTFMRNTRGIDAQLNKTAAEKHAFVKHLLNGKGYSR